MSKQKKPRNKKYVPKGSTAFGGLNLIAKHVLSVEPLSEDQRRNAGLSLHESIVMLELGIGEPAHFNGLAFNVNISRVIHDMDILNVTSEHESLVQDALAALWYCKESAVKVEGAQEYVFSLDGVKLQALKDFSHLHEAHLEIVTQGELDIAKAEMNRRINADIGFREEHARQSSWQPKESPIEHTTDTNSQRMESLPDLLIDQGSYFNAAKLQSSFA